MTFGYTDQQPDDDQSADLQSQDDDPYMAGDYDPYAPRDVQVGDYAKFFVLISDLDKNSEYEAAYYRTDNNNIGGE